jgi:enoyl-[acyl-carrier protein] reductase III
VIDLTGHVALVTGSSRGIGRACALRLAQAGADVVVNYLSRRGAAEEVAGRVVALGRRTLVVRADVSEREDVEAMAAAVTESFGRLDVLVSNAATGGFRPLLATTSHQLAAAMATNVEALLHLLRAFLPLLRSAAAVAGAHGPRRPKVVALSSHGARFALPHYGLVGMTKAALEAAVRQAALELGPEGINVNALVAGAVDTEALRDIPNRDEVLARGAARSLTGGRRLTVDDVADVLLLLASPLADLVQGQTVAVDGGVAVGLG